MNIIVAFSKDFGIGYNGDLPWRLKEDLKHFKKITEGNVVIMGRKTWESLPGLLPGRLNVVLTSQKDKIKSQENLMVCESLIEALSKLETLKKEVLFIIGGSKLYEEAMNNKKCKKLYATEINSIFECDTYIPDPKLYGFKEIKRSSPQNENDLEYYFVEYNRENYENEQSYLNLIDYTLKNGNERSDRTGIGTLSVFGYQMRFNLREYFPLLTTKRMYWKGIVEELLWFLRGDTNAKHLSEKGVKIWDGNSSRQFLDARGLMDYEEGDVGPVYGFQWRHFGAEYNGMNGDYHQKGVDQIKYIIDEIKKNPTSRRLLLTAWNPEVLSQCALPPCHVMCQFYVNNDELSCQLYQRSGDIGLGIPFNIASYSLLTYMIAFVCDLKVGDFIHTIGDAHIYKNHIEPLKEQLKRFPKPFPKLTIQSNHKKIDQFEMKDFKLDNYIPHKSIPMDMAV